MPIYYEDTLENLSALRAGIRVIANTAAITNAGTGQTLFTVTGGRVALVDFYGEIMATMGAGATTIEIDAVPDDVAVVGTSIIATASANIANFVAGRMAYLPVFGGALTFTAAGGACPLKTGPVYLLRPGIVTALGSAVNAGTMRWFAFYVPVDPGAYMTGS